jgi:GMP synthase-like glutamine amidotransferase
VFRVGSAAWGLQGHPEVTADIAAAWAREDSPLLLAAGRDPLSLVAEVRTAEPVLTRTWRPVAERFAGLVRQRAMADA